MNSCSKSLHKYIGMKSQRPFLNQVSIRTDYRCALKDAAALRTGVWLCRCHIVSGKSVEIHFVFAHHHLNTLFYAKRLNTLFHPAFSMHFNAAAGLNLHLTPEFSAFVRVFSISPFFRQHFLHITGHSVPPGISVFSAFSGLVFAFFLVNND